MRRSHAGAALLVVAIVALAGCAQDVVTQMKKSATVRSQVMTAIASDPVYASDITQQMVANDSVRTRVVDTMLLDPRVAQYVLARIGTNPDAVDYLVARMETIRKALAQAR